jgi:DNA-binding NarL/FixJ family response regulator
MADILIVDDHPVVREGIIQLINHKFNGRHTVIGQSDNADSALNDIKERHPDLAVVDIFLKDSDGIELIKRIRSGGLSVNILVLSMHDESLYAERAIKAGAQGYVMKQEESEEIIRAIEKVLDGKIYLSDSMMTLMISNKTTHGEGDGSSLSLLTDRELEVFTFYGTGWTTHKIAEDLHLSVKTVETYCSRIKEKLRLVNMNEVIQHAAHWVDSSRFG